MSTPFLLKKAKILSQLSTPSQTYNDASPKGSVDLPIRALVSAINLIPSLVTTSSCSGRTAIYAAGPATRKGGGAWLFVSHRALPAPIPGSLDALLHSAANEIAPLPAGCSSVSPRRPGHGDGGFFPPAARLVHLKFEPLILHVLCADLGAAKRLLGAALAAGFRESGVASLPAATATADTAAAEGVARRGEEGEGGEDGARKYPRRKRKPQRHVDESVMVAIRTMGLGMDAPIGVVGEEGVEMVVSEGYVASLVGVANERFTVNEERKTRLQEGIMRAFNVEAGRDGHGDDQQQEVIPLG